jgi:hypothetical protein
MFSGLFRSVLSANHAKLLQDTGPIDDLINSMASRPEREINESLVQKLSSYRADLGTVGFKGRYFKTTIETEKAVSHGRVCQMQLPTGKPGAELGDLILAVDYVLDDFAEKKKKIINATASVIQTKKEEYAKQGLTANQLFLMTQWPQFEYKGAVWKLDVFSDAFAFYLFILDPTAKERKKSSVLSGSMLIKYLGVDKASLLNHMNGKIPFPNSSLLRREQVGLSRMPLSFGSFLLRALSLTVGSSSIEFRKLLKKNFFYMMEDVEDCDFSTQTQGQRLRSDNNWPNKYNPMNETDGDVFSVRIKVNLKRVD